MRGTHRTLPAIVGVCATSALMSLSACSFDPSGIAGLGGGADNADASSQRPDASGPTARPDANPGAPDAAPVAPGTLESRATDTPPVLDGEVDAVWASAVFQNFSVADAALTYNVNPAYGFDGAVRFASLHDATHIYFLIVVDDSLIVDDSEQAYQDDAVELYLDGAGDLSGPYGNDDHWLAVQSSGLYQSYGPSHVDLTGAVAPTDDGYLMELAFQRSDLGAPAGASSIGFNLGLVDDDDLGNSDADAYGLWFEPTGDHCDSCCEGEDTAEAWCDTSLLGRLVLSEDA
jgi:hypothetical protein